MARKRLQGPNPSFLSAMDRTAAGPAPIASIAAHSAEAAALEEVTAELEQARLQGRMVQAVAIDQIDIGWLVRDRILIEEGAFAELKASIKAHGQRLPIELVQPDQGERYGLISGARRLLALRDLYEETQDPRFAKVSALLRAPETAVDAYVSMVEENEIRADLSFYERARLVVDSTARGVFPNEAAALGHLFGNVARAKRSKIKSFTELHRLFGETLRHPARISEKLGLALVSRFRHDPAGAQQLTAALAAAQAPTPEEEHAVLQQALDHSEQGGTAPKPSGKTQGDTAKKARTAGPDDPLSEERFANGITLRVFANKVEITGAKMDEDRLLLIRKVAQKL